MLVCCIFCCLCVVFDWTGATRQQRRKKVGLPKTATDAECEYAERRQNLFISSTATEEECVAAEAKVAAERAERARKERDYEEREKAWQKEMDRRYWIDHEEEMRLTGGLGYAERNRRRKAEREEREEGARALMATLYLPPGTTIPEPPRFDAARAMLVGLTGTATVEEVLRREERQHICGRWDASDEAFRHARGELDRARATAAAASDAAAAAREAMRKAKFDAEWAEKTAKDEREHQELMSNIAAKTAKDKAQRQEGRDWLEARAEARAAERDAATAKREATTQARKAERDAYMAKRDEVEAEARDAAAKEREQQFAEQKAPVVQKVAATFLVPEEQRLGEYHSSHDGTIYYKGERIDHGDVGGLEVFGGGYARNGDGTVWFHGKVVEGINARYNSFHVAGNGYALNEGVIVYAGKMVGLTTAVSATGLDHLGDGWSRTRDNTYLFRGEVVSTGAARGRCPHFAEVDEAAVKPVEGTEDNDFLVPEEQRLAGYHCVRGTIYYKGGHLDHGAVGGLEEFGDGYARNGDGTVWFHGKVVEGVNAQYNSFHNAGNGYALNRGVIVYAGKMVGLTTGVMETGLDHLGNGWSRTHDNTYLFRGEVVSTGAARTRCPHFAEVGEAAVKPVEGTEDNDFLVPEEQRLGEYHWGGIEGTIYYKSEEIGQSTGFEDFGDGYARNGEGQVWFHGKVMEGVNAQYDRFANAGNGYAVCQGVLYYAGKEIAADRVRVHPTPGREPLHHLGDGWSRTWPPHHVYFFRGQVVGIRGARTRCPHFVERDFEQETIEAVANNPHTMQGRVLF